MEFIQRTQLLLLSIILFIWVDNSIAQVTNSSSDGFQIKIERDLDCNKEAAYSKLVNGFNQWYDADHSYSQQAKNLSLDLDKCCMLEKLADGGYVRHMEIVFHKPGSELRMTGGLGPLQQMGVSGALTFAFTSKEGGNRKCQVTLTYAVSGADFQKLDKIAVPVNQVLNAQLDRFQKFCK